MDYLSSDPFMKNNTSLQTTNSIRKIILLFWEIYFMLINGSTIISQERITKSPILNGRTSSIKSCKQRKLNTPPLPFQKNASYLPSYLCGCVAFSFHTRFFIYEETFIMARKLAQEKRIALAPVILAYICISLDAIVSHF